MKLHVHTIIHLLVVLGALNWGLIGLINFNIFHILFGNWPGVEQLANILVGVAALIEIVTHKDICKICGKKE
jgi:uncharacterized protein